jgi:signal transduction histidine kinase
MQLVRPKLVAQHVTVKADLQPLPTVRGYPLYLQEAFLNLINNASDAMPDGGKMEVKSWYDSESRLANVQDFGYGAWNRSFRRRTNL